MKAKAIIIMGVSGCGKTTVGQAFARQRGYSFVDADDLHPAENIQKMKSGHPLNDADRSGWLDRIVGVARAAQQQSESCVIACSALKKKYRDQLREGIGSVVFIYLKASFEKVAEHMRQRKDHFMPLALLQSQFDTLEEPAADEDAIVTIHIAESLEATIASALQLPY
ncbi:gluconokinase [Niabella insulamsoli]|uniref:gluconokinase n=1 Tax=Niabella insulamsoli TaxID=3144874 RepID=UPI0031FC7E11